jgi:membrane-bound metal-dependent hydrolase YbcI (DUF457 family)
MMGRSHALSAAVGWLGGCAALTGGGVDVSLTAIGAGVIVSTGFALLPDLDHPGSTVSRTLGPLTRGLSTLTSATSRTARAASCRHCGDRDSGHRGLTHTAVGAVTAGMLATVAGHHWGQTTAMALIGFAAWLASHAALSSTTRAKIGDWLLPGRFRRRGKRSFRFAASVGALLVGVFAAVALTDPAVTSWWWLGIPVAWGCLAHSLGDAQTFSAVPLWWPFEIRGCRWAPVGTPRWMRFRTGSRTETFVVAVLAAAGAISMYVLSNTP